MSTFRTVILGMAIPAGVWLAGCTDPTGPRGAHRTAVLSLDGQVVAPDTVFAHVPFHVSFRTVGGGCVYGGDTDVVVTDRTVDLLPYDVVDGGATVCTDDIRYYTHDVELTLEERGLFDLRVRGLSAPGSAVTIVLERHIVVE